MQRKRNVCFVTGTRAEFGLMQSTLQAIGGHPKLNLQLIATGMHLDRVHGDGLASIKSQGWSIDRIVPWKSNEKTVAGDVQLSLARNTGLATAKLAEAFADLDTEIVLVVGDRVEAFAATTAAHLSGRIVAHVHGGDRAAGQVDDSLRHAITKLAHIHFPATSQSADRLKKLGEDSWRIHRVGSPGIDGIKTTALRWSELSEIVPGLRRRQYALMLYHPVESDDAAEFQRTQWLIQAILATGLPRVVVVYPNNDPGSAGVIKALEVQNDPRIFRFRDVSRPIFLGLLRDAAMLAGNSSSGIIEAGSFGMPVLDVGPRQAGRQRGDNVSHVECRPAQLRTALFKLWNKGHPKTDRSANIYGGTQSGRKIAETLARLKIGKSLSQKLIAY